jgi:Na+/melibiose symporter-like transporter
MYLMFSMIFLALYIALRKFHQSLMLIALVFALLGIGIFLATNNPFSMLALSNQYAAAATDAERSAITAAGQALLVNTNQRAIGSFNMGLLLVSIAGLIVCSVMLKSNSFGRSTALVGILAHALSLADYLRQALTSSVVAALLVILPNALLLLFWHVQVGRRLYHLGRPESKMLSQRS